MTNKKISELSSKGSNLSNTDLLEISTKSGAAYASKSINGQEIINSVIPNFKNYIYGFRLIPDYTNNSTTVRVKGAAPSNIYVNDSQCVDSTGSYVMGTTALQALEVNVALNGSGGLDTGTAANNTRYYVYVLGKSSNPTSLSVVASLSYTGVTGGLVLPVGYDIYRLVGSFKTKVGSTNICEFLQAGVSNERIYIYACDLSENHLADVNNSGLTPVNLTPYVSQLSSSAILTMRYSGDPGNTVIISSNESWDVYINVCLTDQITDVQIDEEIIVAGSQDLATLNQINVQVSSTDSGNFVNLYCRAFYESI